jgi:hypothetical protein
MFEISRHPSWHNVQDLLHLEYSHFRCVWSFLQESLWKGRGSHVGIVRTPTTVVEMWTAEASAEMAVWTTHFFHGDWPSSANRGPDNATFQHPWEFVGKYSNVLPSSNGIVLELCVLWKYLLLYVTTCNYNDKTIHIYCINSQREDNKYHRVPFLSRWHVPLGELVFLAYILE